MLFISLCSFVTQIDDLNTVAEHNCLRDENHEKILDGVTQKSGFLF